MECTGFKSFKSGCLKGFCDFYIKGLDLQIKECALFSKEGRRWISFPKKEYKTKNGEKKYINFLQFKSTESRDKFETEAKKAIDVYLSKNKDVEQKEEVKDNFFEVTDAPF